MLAGEKLTTGDGSRRARFYFGRLASLSPSSF
jgi:hypothetical protein